MNLPASCCHGNAGVVEVAVVVAVAVALAADAVRNKGKGWHKINIFLFCMKKKLNSTFNITPLGAILLTKPQILKKILGEKKSNHRNKSKNNKLNSYMYVISHFICSNKIEHWFHLCCLEWVHDSFLHLFNYCTIVQLMYKYSVLVP